MYSEELLRLPKHNEVRPRYNSLVRVTTQSLKPVLTSLVFISDGPQRATRRLERFVASRSDVIESRRQPVAPFNLPSPTTPLQPRDWVDEHVKHDTFHGNPKTKCHPTSTQLQNERLHQYKQCKFWSRGTSPIHCFLVQ